MNRVAMVKILNIFLFDEFFPLLAANRKFAEILGIRVAAGAVF